MFPNEPIVRKMQLSKSKIAYVIPFGLAPYFRKLCINKVQKAEEFVICFDESFNKQLKQGQMDLLDRLWNNETDRVEVCYLTSELLGHQRAEDLLSSLEKGLAELNKKKIIQITMDGPNVNWKVMRLFKENIRVVQMIHCCWKQVLVVSTQCMVLIKQDVKLQGGNLIPTLKLHIEVLRAAYYLFKQTSARREDFMNITDSTV